MAVRCIPYPQCMHTRTYYTHIAWARVHLRWQNRLRHREKELAKSNSTACSTFDCQLCNRRRAVVGRATAVRLPSHRIFINFVRSPHTIHRSNRRLICARAMILLHHRNHIDIYRQPQINGKCTGAIILLVGQNAEDIIEIGL